MAENPYQSPHEAGYSTPEQQARRARLRKLVVFFLLTALIWAALIGIRALVMWLGN